jgi:hypothetical protein
MMAATANEEKHVATGSSPPAHSSSFQSNPTLARQTQSVRFVITMQALFIGFFVAVVFVVSLGSVDAQTEINRESHQRPSVHHRPCASMAGKSMTACGSLLSTNNQLAAAAVVSPPSESNPTPSLSLSSSGYVTNVNYRFTPGDLANRKYAQLKQHNQQMIHRLQAQSNLTNSSPISSAETSRTAGEVTVDSNTFSTANFTSKHGDSRIFEDIYGVQGTLFTAFSATRFS